MGCRSAAVALVDSDLAATGATARGVLDSLTEHEQIIGKLQSAVASSDAALPFIRTPSRSTGWGPGTLHLWKRPAEPGYPADHEPASGWACAMEALDNPGTDVFFQISLQGSPTLRWPCASFLRPTRAESELLLRYLNDPIHRDGSPSKVLDIGCGVGRHLRCIRDHCQDLDLWGTERDPVLLSYCMREFGPNIYSDQTLIPDTDFDAIILLGNGIGLFGSAPRLEDGLQRVLSNAETRRGADSRLCAWSTGYRLL